MAILGSLFVIRRAKVKTAVTKDWISGFTEITHTILFGYFFLYLVLSLCQSHIHTGSQGLLMSISFGNTQSPSFLWGCISLLHAEHTEAVVSWWCCLLWITSLWGIKVQAVGDEAGETFGMYEAKFYVILLLLPNEQNHTDPTAELAQWAVSHLAWMWACILAAKGMELPPLSLTALEGRECDIWFSSRQKFTVRHWSGKRTSPRSRDSHRHAWESLCLVLVLWLTCVISQVMTSEFLSSFICDACLVLLAVMWHQGIAHLFFWEFIALSTRAWIAHMGVERRTTYSLAPISA